MHPIRSVAAGLIVSGAGLAVAGPAGSSHAGPSQVVRNGLIAYTSGARPPMGPFVIRTVNPDGTGSRLLLGPDRRFRDGASGPKWSRDGTKLLFFRHPWRQDRRALWYSNASGTDIRRIPLRRQVFNLDNGSSYAWAPGGRRIVFAGDLRSGKSGAYTISIRGSNRKTAWSRKGWRPVGPSWSGDGRHIAFTAYRRDLSRPSSRLAVVRPNGKGFRWLTRSRHDEFADFSPDSKEVLLVRNFGSAQEYQWRRVTVDGRRNVLIAKHEARSEVVYCPPQWSPDGKRLATVRKTDGSAGADPLTAAFVTFSPEGQDERVEFQWPETRCDFDWRPELD